jgi:hypothetical protein
VVLVVLVVHLVLKAAEEQVAYLVLAASLV